MAPPVVSTGLIPLRPCSSKPGRRPAPSPQSSSHVSSHVGSQVGSQAGSQFGSQVGSQIGSQDEQQSQETNLARLEHEQEPIPCRPHSQASSRSKSRKSCGRKLLCNWGGRLGQQTVLSVDLGLEPIRAPYNVTVFYDLRPVLRSLVGVEAVYLAALDAEQLRRKGSGIGLDSLQASESWIARDCICTRSGKLRPLTAWKCPGKVNIQLRPGPTSEQEAYVLLRLIAVRLPWDPQDWNAVGAAVVLRVDTVGKLLQPESLGPPQHQRLLSSPSPVPAGLPECTPEEGESEIWGIRLQQLLDFREEVREDVERYCSTHCLCLQEGEYKYRHVCLHDPCPYRPLNAPKFDDHRGVPFVQHHRLSEDTELCPLIPNVSFIVRRYIIPPDNSDKNLALLIKPRQPLKVGTYITHTGTDSFMDFVETLEGAFDPDDAIYVSSFARALRAGGQEQSSGWDPLDEDPCSKALQTAEKFVVVVDKALSFTQCLWCHYEIKWAREWRTASFIWPHKAVDFAEMQSAVDKLDLRHLTSANPEDELNFRRAIEGNDVDLGVVSQQLREFLQDRIVSFAATLQLAVELKEVSPEKIRRLHVEHERRKAIKDFQQEHRQELADRDARIEQLERELMEVNFARKCEQEELQLEVDSLNNKLTDIQASNERRNAGLEKEMRENLGDMQREVRRLHDLLKESRAKTAQAEERIDILTRELAAQKREADEAGQRAEAAVLKAEIESGRAEHEREAVVEEQKLSRALTTQLQEMEREFTDAKQAQNKAENELRVLAAKHKKMMEKRESIPMGKISKSGQYDSDDDDEALVIDQGITMPSDLQAEFTHTATPSQLFVQTAPGDLNQFRDGSRTKTAGPTMSALSSSLEDGEDAIRERSKSPCAPSPRSHSPEVTRQESHLGTFSGMGHMASAGLKNAASAFHSKTVNLSSAGPPRASPRSSTFQGAVRGVAGAAGAAPSLARSISGSAATSVAGAAGAATNLALKLPGLNQMRRPSSASRRNDDAEPSDAGARIRSRSPSAGT